MNAKLEKAFYANAQTIATGDLYRDSFSQPYFFFETKSGLVVTCKLHTSEEVAKYIDGNYSVLDGALAKEWAELFPTKDIAMHRGIKSEEGQVHYLVDSQTRRVLLSLTNLS